MDKWLNKIT